MTETSSDCFVSYPGHSRTSWYILQPQPTGQENEENMWINPDLTGTEKEDAFKIKKKNKQHDKNKTTENQNNNGKAINVNENLNILVYIFI